MAESTKNKRGRATSTKSGPAKTAQRAAAKSSNATVKSSATKSNSTTQGEVVVHKTSSGPSSDFKAKSNEVINSVTSTLSKRTFWFWVGGILAAILVVLLAWWQWQRSYVAVVNGQYIPTTTLYGQLMASGGSDTLNNITQQQLILQQAQREKVAVSNNEIQEELNKFKDTTGGEDQYRSSLKEFGISEDLLRNQIEVRLTLEKILADKIKVSDKEIEDYYNANKEEVDVANEGLEGARERIETQLSEQKLNQESSNYIASLQEGSSISVMPHHTSLTFSEFLAEEVWSIPEEIWNLFTQTSK